MMAREYQKLRARIVELFGSQGAFSKEIGLSEQSLTAKLNGKRQFSQTDIVRWSNALKIEADEVGEYFFAYKL